jgi:catechol 2,3-dioxygenase-like lactoylglutathione lyase family enzyme
MSDRETPLHHLEIAVSDLPVALAFWGWFVGELGFEPYEQWEGGASFRRGDFYVVIRTAEADLDLDPPFREGRVGLHHVAFHAASRTQVDAVTDGVRARGYEVLYDDRHPFAGGYYALYCRGPDGIKIELVAPD